MGSRAESSETLRQYNKMEHLVEHMKVSFHSPHEPACGICMKHCRSFHSLREHFIGPQPKMECAEVYSSRGCSYYLNIFECPQALRIHRASCQLSQSTPVSTTTCQPVLISSVPKLSLQNFLKIDSRMQSARVVALACKMVGERNDGSLDICARVCIVDREEDIIFHTYVRPKIPVTNYRYEKTGFRPERLRDAMPLPLPLKQAQRKIQDFLCNGEPQCKVRSRGTRARILVDHGLDNDLESLEIEYPQILIRYEIQTGIQDPYEDCVAAIRLYIYVRLRARPHSRDYASDSGAVQNRNNFATWWQRELEKMNSVALLEISVSDYYCWYLDAQRD